MFYEWKSGDYIYRNEKPRYYVLKKVDSLDYSGFEPTVIKDKIDYPFIEDPQVLGKWETVDFVKEIESFDPDKKSLEAEPYLLNLEFLDSGVLFGIVGGGISSDISWTKGLVLNPNNVTASKYIIKEINGSKYMFYEWKSGDYTLRGMKPQYYVLKKVG
jgi:bla regulator protein BlaR1